MNFSEKLERQRLRRSDTSLATEGAMPLYEADAMASFSDIKEDSEAKRARKYALQAMSPVSKRSTDISIEEGERIRQQLESNLNERIDFRYQGSVTTNTHIKSVSDIDLLVITQKFQSNEPPLKPTIPYSNGNKDLISLKDSCYRILKNIYPQAKVELKSKSIRIFGGSLRRDVDVVPSNWHNTEEFKNTNNEIFRGINILDTDTQERTNNYPFYNKQMINQKDTICMGRYKKIIRLTKTIKADSDNPNVDSISSYDIQALFYHLDDDMYQKVDGIDLIDLGIDYLDTLLESPDYFNNLKVIDRTRKISEKVSINALKALRNEYFQLYQSLQ